MQYPPTTESPRDEITDAPSALLRQVWVVAAVDWLDLTRTPKVVDSAQGLFERGVGEFLLHLP